MKKQKTESDILEEEQSIWPGVGEREPLMIPAEKEKEESLGFLKTRPKGNKFPLSSALLDSLINILTQALDRDLSRRPFTSPLWFICVGVARPPLKPGCPFCPSLEPQHSFIAYFLAANQSYQQ